MKFRAPFPTGPNGFRTVEGRELNPENPTDYPQARFDELVQAVAGHGTKSAIFVADGEKTDLDPISMPFAKKTVPKPAALTVDRIANNSNDRHKKQKGMNSNRIRQQVNQAGLTGRWRGRYYENGVSRKKS